jgi:hypothetical protein
MPCAFSIRLANSNKAAQVVLPGQSFAISSSVNGFCTRSLLQSIKASLTKKNKHHRREPRLAKHILRIGLA